MDYNYRFNKESNFQREMLANEQAFTERMWNQTNDWNLQQWNRENEYNSPAAQMQRAMEAGINPNSVLGGNVGGQASSLAASVPSSPTAPSAPSQPAGDTFSSVMGSLNGLGDTVLGIAKYLDSERDLTNAAIDKTREETKTTNITGRKMLEELKGQKYENKYLKPAQLAQLESIAAKNLADKELTDAEHDKVVEETNNVKKEGEYLQKQIDSYDEQIKLIKEKIRTEQSEQARNAAAAELDYMQSQKAEAEKNYQNLINDYETKLQKIGASTKETGDIVSRQETRKALGAANALEESEKNEGDYQKSEQNATSAATEWSTGPQKWQTGSGSHRNPTYNKKGKRQ